MARGTKVTITRVWEVNCEEHGVLDAPRQYSLAKQSREDHRRDFPQCFDQEDNDGQY